MCTINLDNSRFAGKFKRARFNPASMGRITTDEPHWLGLTICDKPLMRLTLCYGVLWQGFFSTSPSGLWQHSRKENLNRLEATAIEHFRALPDEQDNRVQFIISIEDKILAIKYVPNYVIWLQEFTPDRVHHSTSILIFMQIHTCKHRRSLFSHKVNLSWFWSCFEIFFVKLDR